MIDRATDIARDIGPGWEVIPALFDVAIRLNASDWERAADRADAVAELRQRAGVGRFSAWATWIEAAAHYAVGRPLTREELQRRLDGGPPEGSRSGRRGAPGGARRARPFPAAPADPP